MFTVIKEIEPCNAMEYKNELVCLLQISKACILPQFLNDITVKFSVFPGWVFSVHGWSIWGRLKMIGILLCRNFLLCVSIIILLVVAVFFLWPSCLDVSVAHLKLKGFKNSLDSTLNSPKVPNFSILHSPPTFQNRLSVGGRGSIVKGIRFNSFNGGASLLSDAASHPAWKHINKNPSSSPCPYSSLPASQALNRLNFKKAVIRPNTKLSDPDLEDTASSPVSALPCRDGVLRSGR